MLLQFDSTRCEVSCPIGSRESSELKNFPLKSYGARRQSHSIEIEFHSNPFVKLQPLIPTSLNPNFNRCNFHTMVDFHPEISVSLPTHDGLYFWQFMIAGSIAGSVEHMTMFPVDTLKTRIQAIGGSSTVRQALGSILKMEGPAGLYSGIGAMGLGAGLGRVVKQDGYNGLMKGWIPRVFFHAPAAAICWSTYEASKTFFQQLHHSNN